VHATPLLLQWQSIQLVLLLRLWRLVLLLLLRLWQLVLLRFCVHTCSHRCLGVPLSSRILSANCSWSLQAPAPHTHA
jgi:hypothetical protein